MNRTVILYIAVDCKDASSIFDSIRENIRNPESIKFDRQYKTIQNSRYFVEICTLNNIKRSLFRADYFLQSNKTFSIRMNEIERLSDNLRIAKFYIRPNSVEINMRYLINMLNGDC